MTSHPDALSLLQSVLAAHFSVNCILRSAAGSLHGPGSSRPASCRCSRPANCSRSPAPKKNLLQPAKSCSLSSRETMRLQPDLTNDLPVRHPGPSVSGPPDGRTSVCVGPGLQWLLAGSCATPAAPLSSPRLPAARRPLAPVVLAEPSVTILPSSGMPPPERDQQ